MSKQINEFNNFIPNIVIFSFGDSPSTELYGIPIEARLRVKFIKIGSRPPQETKTFEAHFFDWRLKDKFGNYKNKVLSPEKLYNENHSELQEILENADLVVIPVPTREVEVVRYAAYFAQFASEFNILIFHLVINSIIFSDKLEGVYRNLQHQVRLHKNVLINLHEINLISQFEGADLINREAFVQAALNNLASTLISSFLEIGLNPRLYNRIKAQTLLRDDTHPDVWLGAYGSSNVKEDRFEKALFNALSSPVFQGAFRASKKFFVIISGTFLSEAKIQKVKDLLVSIAGPNAEVIMARVVQDYVFENIVKVTIFARDINEAELVNDRNELFQSIDSVLLKLRDLIQNENTKEYILSTYTQKMKLDSK